MADNTGSVLKFTRDAAFINRRAKARRDAGDDIEALGLYRRACEEAPCSAAYRMDLANMLRKMGCIDASYDEFNRMINDGAISTKTLTQEPALRGMLLGQAFNLSDMGYNKAALTMFRTFKCVFGGYSTDGKEDDSTGMSDVFIARMIISQTHLSRIRFIKRMLHFIDDGDVLHAHVASRRYLARRKASALGHISLAWALYNMDEQAQATEHMVRALTTMRKDPWVLYIASRILAGSDSEQAQITLMNASFFNNSHEFNLLMLRQAAALDMHSLVLNLTERILKRNPGAPYPSACRAVALINTGASARAALLPLQNCLKIYPGNITACHYEALLSSSPEAPLAYPDKEMLRQWASLVSALRTQVIAGGAKPPLCSSDDIKLLAWGLHSADTKISTSSAALLTDIGGSQARDELWRYLASCNTPDKFRLDALAMMMASDMPLPRLIFLRGELRSLNETSLARIVALRESCRSVRIAAHRLHLREHPNAIFDMRSMLLLAGNMELNSDELASALECAMRIKYGEAISLREIANRRSINCARLTRAVYAYLQIAGNQEEEP